MVPQIELSNWLDYKTVFVNAISQFFDIWILILPHFVVFLLYAVSIILSDVVYGG